MNNTLYLAGIFFIASVSASAAICPDPHTSSLRWGEIPAPWIENPFSEHSPQGDEQTTFVRANILVAGMGRGVACTYQNSIGYYSIWWPVSVKIPGPADYYWRSSLGGFECTDSLVSCVFYPANG